MDSAPRHLSEIDLQQGLTEVEAAPPDAGRLDAIFVRPGVGERRTLTTATLTAEGGIDGDRWATDGRHDDGRPDPRNQVSLMNARLLRLIADQSEAMCLAGDNLIIDFDLSDENLPTGSRLAIGQVVLEITDLAHTGCTKFSKRYGQQARQFVNSPRGKELHLRGRYARIVTGGTISVGDSVLKCAAASTSSC
jgi:MOSC domain-containing protein YiiM